MRKPLWCDIAVRWFSFHAPFATTRLQIAVGLSLLKTTINCQGVLSATRAAQSKSGYVHARLSGICVGSTRTAGRMLVTLHPHPKMKKRCVEEIL